MKSVSILILCSVILVLHGSARAQNQSQIPQRYKNTHTSSGKDQPETHLSERETANNAPTVSKAKKLNIMSGSERTYSSEELMKMPLRDVNAIANTVSGVNSYGGGTPSIMGAPPSGTAYFIDGVRVNGPLGLPSFR